jgi:hypothetical protein
MEPHRFRPGSQPNPIVGRFLFSVAAKNIQLVVHARDLLAMEILKTTLIAFFEECGAIGANMKTQAEYHQLATFPLILWFNNQIYDLPILNHFMCAPVMSNPNRVCEAKSLSRSILQRENARRMKMPWNEPLFMVDLRWTLPSKLNHWK